MDSEYKEEFVFEAEPTVIVDGQINYDLIDPDLVIKVAGYPEYKDRLFAKLKEGGQKLYDQVLADPSLVD